MRGVIGKYETIVRLGLVFIVFLLLLLNINTTYVLHDVRDQLRDDVDHRLASGLNHIKRYLAKNNLQEIDVEQEGQLKQKYELSWIGIRNIKGDDIDLLRSHVIDEFGDNEELPILTEDDLNRLREGKSLYCTGRENGSRIGMALVTISPGRHSLIHAETESNAITILSRAARMTLYLAAAVIILIVPIVIGLPRQILKPFKTMRETARSAGRLIPSQDSDEVTEVIKSYESIIEELKRSETKLEKMYHESSSRADRLERVNRYILKSIGSGVINVDLTGKVIGYNRAARDILGYDDDLVLDKNYLVAFPQELELSLFIEAGLERGEVSGRREIVLTRPDEPDRWLGVESSIILDDNERVIGVTLLFTDLTELKKLHSELETNRRLAALGEMTGGLAHQLRNSLAAISGFSQLLQKKTGQDSDLADISSSIRAEAASSEQMVSRFLNFSKPLCLSEEVFGLERFLEDSLAKYSSAAKSAGTGLKIMPNEGEFQITGDPLLLKEAFCNIIANALEAAGREGEVEIGAKISGTNLLLLVKDNGPGIPESIKDKLFTPFVSSKPSGTGLGLALTRKIVNLHNGHISFESASSGGTICRINLPDRVCISETFSISANNAAKKQ